MTCRFPQFTASTGYKKGCRCGRCYGYMSQANARTKARYRGTCETCGGPTNGSAGPGRASTACLSCLEWSGEAIIAALQDWAQAHGGVPPSHTEWRAAGEGWPCATVVDRRFGWNNALLKAGFELRCDRRPETQAEIERLIRAGVPVADIAGRFGVTAAAIYRRMQWRGTTVEALRDAA